MYFILLMLSVALGGALGTALRFFISSLAKKLHIAYGHIGTLTVNIMGCFGIGFFYVLFSAFPNTPEKYFIITGILGGLTTFSSFTLDVYKLHREDRLKALRDYLLFSLLGGACSFILGLSLAHLFW